MLSPSMSSGAGNILLWLAAEYARAKFPNHRVWNFTFPNDDPVAAELRALGQIQMMGTKGRDGTRWRMTDEGQRWLMRHHAEAQETAGSVAVARSLGISLAAHALLRKVVRDYREAGSPPLYNIAWGVASDDEATTFGELQGAGLMEEHTVTKWRLTEHGRTAGMS
jgi:hypothetical protein